jgi:hypothetical protein
MTKFFTLLLFIFLSFGCQKYEIVSPPNLTGGKWVFTGYDISLVSAISPVKIIKNDTICINTFNNQNFISGDVLMKQNYNNTSIDRRFIKGVTTWEFDGTSQATRFPLYVDYVRMVGSVKPDNIYATLNQYYDRIEVMNMINGSTTNYTISNTQNMGYSNTLTLLSPPIVTDLYLSDGTRDKAVTVRVSLYFSR